MRNRRLNVLKSVSTWLRLCHLDMYTYCKNSKIYSKMFSEK